MTPDDAAELGVYASDLFRFVTEAQQTALAELMLPLREVTDSANRTLQTAVDVGRGILRTIAASTEDEQRLNLNDVRREVLAHMRRHGYAPPDVPPNAWQSEREATQAAAQYEDSTHRWACQLPENDVAELTAEAMKSIMPHAHFLFKDKDIRTSKTLRILAHDYYRKARAFG